MPDKALNNATAKPAPVPRSFSLGSHIPANKPGFSSRVMLFVCASITLAVTPSTHAQTTPCGLTSMTEAAAPQYPPIAKVAHVEGTVILMARFSSSGNVEHITELSGPALLRKASVASVKTWQANEYSGPRECPIVLNFQLSYGADMCDIPPEPPVPYERIDPQHVTVRGRMVALCDPGAVITRKHRFHIF